jgi:hypothetical protein
VTLSSGAASTMHSDFWNTWDQTELVFHHGRYGG